MNGFFFAAEVPLTGLATDDEFAFWCHGGEKWRCKGLLSSYHFVFMLHSCPLTFLYGRPATDLASPDQGLERRL